MGGRGDDEGRSLASWLAVAVRTGRLSALLFLAIRYTRALLPADRHGADSSSSSVPTRERGAAASRSWASRFHGRQCAEYAECASESEKHELRAKSAGRGRSGEEGQQHALDSRARRTSRYACTRLVPALPRIRRATRPRTSTPRRRPTRTARASTTAASPAIRRALDSSPATRRQRSDAKVDR